MKAEHIKALTHANNTMLTSQNAARATLEEVVAAFPNCAAITNQADAVCKAVLKNARENFNTEVKRLFLEATKSNTISI